MFNVNFFFILDYAGQEGVYGNQDYGKYRY